MPNPALTATLTATFLEPDGTAHVVNAPLGRSLMQAAQDHGVPGIPGDCGGFCSCATCHGYIDERYAAHLPTMGESEAAMLDSVPVQRGNSRLCCQIKLKPELDGIVVQLPDEQV